LEAETRLGEARIHVAETRQRLLNFGLAPAGIEELAESEEPGSLLPILAPLDGVVVRRHAVVGEAAEATTELFTVANLATMWVLLDLYESDLRRVREGQPVTFTVGAMPGSSYAGRLTWIDPEVNPETRTIPVRAEVENGDGLLRCGTFGTGAIEIEAPAEALVVPKTAVQRHEGSAVLFVRKAAALFEPRRVSVGRKEGPWYEITNGLEPGEPVVTTGSFLLKTELMKGAIGAGCCGD
jgi:cobalt-zinc-cadmium efflux system membrane fusion protein